MSSLSRIQVLQKLLGELRKISSSKKISDTLQVRFVMDQYRANQVTDLQLCKAQEELNFFAETYLCYLESLRRSREIHHEYRGQGERSVAETAKMVGFKLPHDPK